MINDGSLPANIRQWDQYMEYDISHLFFIDSPLAGITRTTLPIPKSGPRGTGNFVKSLNHKF